MQCILTNQVATYVSLNTLYGSLFACVTIGRLMGDYKVDAHEALLIQIISSDDNARIYDAYTS